MPDPGYEYASLQEAKDSLFISTTQYDALLPIWIQEASAAIDTYTNRPDGFHSNGEPTAREFGGSGKAIQWIDECTRVTKVEVKPSVTSEDSEYITWSTADYLPGRGDPVQNPVFGDFPFRPYQWLMTKANAIFPIWMPGRFGWLRGFRPDTDYGEIKRTLPTVRVTANWGYSLSTPPQIKLACIMQVGRWKKRLESGMTDSATAPDFGIETFRKHYETLDNEVAMLLIKGRFCRPSGIAR